MIDPGIMLLTTQIVYGFPSFGQLWAWIWVVHARPLRRDSGRAEEDGRRGYGR
jgi:hypothetical protein